MRVDYHNSDSVLKVDSLFKKHRTAHGSITNFIKTNSVSNPDFAWGLHGEFGAIKESIFEKRLQRIYEHKATAL